MLLGRITTINEQIMYNKLWEYKQRACLLLVTPQPPPTLVPQIHISGKRRIVPFSPAGVPLPILRSVRYRCHCWPDFKLIYMVVSLGFTGPYIYIYIYIYMVHKDYTSIIAISTSNYHSAHASLSID